MPFYSKALENILGQKESLEKGFGHVSRGEEYKAALQAVEEDFKAGNYRKAFEDAKFIIFKFLDDLMETALKPLGLYNGYTDEELRERISQDGAWTTIGLLSDLFENTVPYQRLNNWLRRSSRFKVGKYTVDPFGWFPDGFDPVDAIYTFATFSRKNLLGYLYDDWHSGNKVNVGKEVVRSAIPIYIEEILGHLKYDGFFLDNIVSWLFADSMQMEHERAYTPSRVAVAQDYSRRVYRDFMDRAAAGIEEHIDSIFPRNRAPAFAYAR